MWKFLKNLFKKKDTEERFTFNYDTETEVIVTKRLDDDYDLEINTTRDLTDDDLMKIISHVKKRI